MRVELRDGQWAELREHITHGEDKEIRRARVKASEDAEHFAGEPETVAIRIIVKSWNVRDVNGDTLPLDAPDAIDRMPSDIADTLLGHVVAIITGVTSPNSSTPPSSDA